MASKPKFVVGLGASAGGLEALENCFDHLPLDSDCAFIVVMHLSRDFKSMLDELLARHTGMKVHPARNGEEMQGNNVYVIQPKTTVEVDGLRLDVSTRPDVDPSGAATSIDTLFKSIAKHWGNKGAAIVLSGSGSDGAKGIVAVREADGFTCAQAPETAKFDSMPVAAIATDCVNAIEAPEQIGQIVIEGLLLPPISTKSNILSDHDAAMKEIIDSVIGASDLDARQYKHSTFERRVQRRMMDLRIKSLSEYAQKIGEDPKEAEALSQALLIGVTDFFRDDAPYSIIKQQIIPEIIKQAYDEDRSIRIWCPGCATGEEPYSIAMLFREALLDMPFKIEVQIFATDISRKHLEEAGRGEYSEERISNVPEDLRSKYFSKNETDGRWTVNTDLRKMIVFAPHDLLSDPPFTKLDLITCRNILIYFSIEAQQRIIGGFSFGLKERAFLFLGASETVGGQRDAFEFIDARNRIFRRTGYQGSRSALARTRELYPILTGQTSRQTKSTKAREIALQPVYAAILKDYAPASLLVDSNRELTHSFGEATQYLSTQEGLANLDITEMVDRALRTPIIAALERAVKDKKPLTFSRIELDATPEAGKIVDLTVRPLLGNEDDQVSHLLIVIDGSKYGSGDKTDQEIVPAYSSDALVQSQITELQEDLDRTREALQSTIEEIETANEELQASNEELMSANEELQSTNEELSSVNEELYSVNAEYHRQNDDLTRLTSDFDLLLNATNIGVLFLDKDAKITRYTGLAGELFNLHDNDIGRPLSNFRSPFVGVDPEKLRKEAKMDDHVHETEVVHENGSNWLVRSVSDENNFESVLAFIDISELRNAEKEARDALTMLEAIRKTTRAYYLELNFEMSVVTNQLGFDEYVGIEDMTLPYELPFTNVHPDDLDMLKKTQAEIKANGHGELIYRMWNAESENYRFIRAVGTRSDEGKWRLAAYDVDDIFRSEQETLRQKAILDATLSVSRSFKAFIDSDNRYQFVNNAYRTQFGIGELDIAGLLVEDVLPEHLYSQVRDKIKTVRRGEDAKFTLEAVVDGEMSMLSVEYKPVLQDGDEIIGFVVDGLDVSNLIEYGRQLDATDRTLCIATRQSNQAVMIIEINSGLIEFANRTAMTRLGIKQENFLPNQVKVSRITPEWGDKRWQDYFEMVLDGVKNLENDVVFFDGSSKTARADVFTEIVKISETENRAVVRIFENSEKLQMLDDLRDRSQQLAISNRELEQFTSAVAHDLRTPLRHISQFAEMLEKNQTGMTSEEMTENAGIIGKSSKTLSHMVTGLLDYARIGRAQPELGSCDLNEAVASATQLLTGEIEKTGAKITVGDLPTVTGDSDLMIQLFQNLIANSIKYRKKDSDSVIEIDAVEDHGMVEVRISDNGIGINPDYGDRIFELFRRLHGDKEYSGLGLGLATCRRIAELHKARIELDTGYEDGSRFILTNLVKNVP